MNLVAVENDGKKLTLTGTEGEVENMLAYAIRYGAEFKLTIDSVNSRMGHAYDDRDLTVEYR